jgi:hypothetical protein
MARDVILFIPLSPDQASLFGSPTPPFTFEEAAVVEEAVEHSGGLPRAVGRTIPSEVSPHSETTDYRRVVDNAGDLSVSRALADVNGVVILLDGAVSIS